MRRQKLCSGYSEVFRCAHKVLFSWAAAGFDTAVLVVPSWFDNRLGIITEIKYHRFSRTRRNTFKAGGHLWGPVGVDVTARSLSSVIHEAIRVPCYSKSERMSEHILKKLLYSHRYQCTKLNNLCLQRARFNVFDRLPRTVIKSLSTVRMRSACLEETDVVDN